MSKQFVRAWDRMEYVSIFVVAILTAVLFLMVLLPLWLTKAIDTQNLIALENGVLVSEETVNFGNTEINEEIVQSFVIANPLNEDLNLRLHTDAKEFAIVGASKIVLEPQETRKLNLKFMPDKVGSKEANLILVAEQLPDSTTTIFLQGRGLAQSYGENFFSTLKIVEFATDARILNPQESLLINYRLNLPAYVTVTIQQDNRIIKTVENYAGLKTDDLAVWDGTDNLGKFVPAGVYRYVIDAFSDKGGADTVSGNFTVVSDPDVSGNESENFNMPSVYVPKEANVGKIVEITTDFKKATTVDLQVIDESGRLVEQLWRERNVGAGIQKAFWQPEQTGNYLVKLQVLAADNIGASSFVSEITINDENKNSQNLDLSAAQSIKADDITPMTRAQAMAYLVKELGLATSLYRPETDLNLGFIDLSSETWLLSPFKTLIKTGWLPRLDEYGIQFKKMIEGTNITQPMLEPERALTRAELHKLFVEGLMNRPQGTTLQIDRNPKVFCFNDLANNKDTRWYLPYAQFACNELKNTELLQKYHTDKNFDAGATVTRDYLETLLKVGRTKAWW